MKILICGGGSEADYVLSAFAKTGNQIVVRNDDKKVADRISEHWNIPVLVSDPTKIYSFETADVTGFDLVIALRHSDADNFVCCKIAKELLGIKKAICTVHNPHHVRLFVEMGVDSPISSTYLLTERIKGESDIESVFRTSSLENDKLVITEIRIKPSFWCVGMSLKNLGLPKTGNITCIFRDPTVIIPRGDTRIQAEDTLIIASAPENQAELVKFIKG